MATVALSSLSSSPLHNNPSPRRNSLQGINLFSSLPSTPPPNHLPPSTSPTQIKPPIPPPKYPPPCKKQPNPAFKLTHRNTKYYKPIADKTVLSSEGERAVVVGENGVSYLLPDAPFEFQYSYSETPRVKPLAIREPAFLPFGPPTMARPWTGKAPLKKSKKKTPLFDPTYQKQNSENSIVKQVAMPLQFGKYPKKKKSREEIIGEPLKKWEIKIMIKPYLSDNRQVNLGRDGLTHNMLELIHCHWKRQPICKVRCKGVPTVDMDNVCFHLEEKTGGKIIHRVGGVVYLFRGRNYDPKDRPQYPVMLWKPAAPVYPKLIQDIPEGLTRSQANELREKGKSLLPICKLAKNGVYITLVNDVRAAFEGSPLVKIDCKGMHASDYKKLGAKLKELVPCVLLSFDDEQILMWRGQNWKSMYPETPALSFPAIANESEDSGKTDDNADYILNTEVLKSSPRMMSLWKHALESSKAILLDEIDLGPDELLRKVEEFERISQTTDHTYPVLLLTSEDHEKGSVSEFEYSSNGENSDEEEDDLSGDEYDDHEFSDSDSFEDMDATKSAEKLPIDLITESVLKAKMQGSLDVRIEVD